MSSVRLAKRFGQVVLTIWVVITVTFVLIRQIPGGPIDYIGAQLLQSGNADPGQIRELAKLYLNLRPDQPLHVQYFDYTAAILQGDFGQSIWFNEPVNAILARALPWTIFLMSIATILSYAIAISLGALLAYIEGSRTDNAITVFSTVLNSTPFYLFAVILLLFLAYTNEWFPTGGHYSSDVSPGLSIAFLTSALHHAALPIASVVATEFGGQALQMRGNSIQELGKDYLRVARLRGLSRNRIVIQYVARNAVLPMYTGLMISIGFLFGGSIILEQLFTYPGAGYYLFRAINARDYPLMMGGFIVITVAVVLGLFIADLTYGKLDPRIGGGEGRESY